MSKIKNTGLNQYGKVLTGPAVKGLTCAQTMYGNKQN